MPSFIQKITGKKAADHGGGKNFSSRLRTAQGVVEATQSGLLVPPGQSIADYICYVEERKELLVVKSIANKPEYYSYKQHLISLGMNICSEGETLVEGCVREILLETEKFNIQKDNFLNSKGFVSADSQEDTRIIAETKQIIEDAARMGASDIHFDTTATSTLVRFRVQGDLVVYRELTEGEATMRVIYSTMATKSETAYMPGKPQDGNIGKDSPYLPDNVVGARIVKAGSAYGDFMVLRLQPKRKEERSSVSVEDRLSKLGYSLLQVDDFKNMMSKPTGITIICGVTGSGKTTTLSALTQSLRDDNPEKMIMTTEDPVEIYIDGVRQTSVSLSYEKAIRSPFAESIRAALRSDPDILMISEMRDSDSAYAALNGAMTGHPLLTTLHANGAWESLKRFQNMLEEKIKDPLEYLSDPSLVSGLVYQKLLKRTCQYCAKSLSQYPDFISRDLLERILVAEKKFGGMWNIDNVLIMNPGQHDCPECHGRGYSGRFVCAETVNLTPKLLTVYSGKGMAAAKHAWLFENHGKTYRMMAAEKMLVGMVDPGEIENMFGRIGAEEFYYKDENAEKQQYQTEMLLLDQLRQQEARHEQEMKEQRILLAEILQQMPSEKSDDILRKFAEGGFKNHQIV